MKTSFPVYSLGLSEIQKLLATDMRLIDNLFRAQLYSDVDLIVEIVEHHIGAGGKRMRPMLVLLAGYACGGHGENLRKLAAAIEFIHSSTLLHDDVVDKSLMRRGCSTANAIWGSHPSVLVGDFLYSRSFHLMVALGSMDIMRVISETVNQLAEGEILQLQHVHNADIDETAYMRVIKNKTAALFAASTMSGAVLAGAEPDLQRRMQMFGEHLGYAFQIADDVLDYTADAEQLGKNLGDDLAEGKVTLPLIHALNVCHPIQRNRLREIIQTGEVTAMGEVMEAIRTSDAVEYSLLKAEDHVQIAIQALESLPDSEMVAALRGLALYAIKRNH